MGTPIPPNESDNICTICWGVGKTWAAENQARYIWAQVSNIMPGEHWDSDLESLLLEPHVLIQQDFPCFFVVEDSSFSWVLVFQGLFTEFRINHLATNTKAFWDVASPRCSMDFTDAHPPPAGRFGIGGTCHCSFDGGLV